MQVIVSDPVVASGRVAESNLEFRPCTIEGRGAVDFAMNKNLQSIAARF